MKSRESRHVRCGATLLLSAVLAACGLDAGEALEGGASVPTVRDSAGVRVVENGHPGSSAWRVTPTPQFTVGWHADDPTFTWIQSGRILPDGGAVVGDFRSGSMFRIGPDGAVLATWGRKGDGPGEYQAFDALLQAGDSILVSDLRLRRLTVLSLDGDVRGTRPLPGAFMHQVSSVMPDGRLLLIPGDSYSGVSSPRPEWVFEHQPIIAAALDGNAVDTLIQLPHLRRWYGTRGGNPGPVRVVGRAGGLADGFAWGRSDRPEISYYDGEGRLVQLARWDEAPVPVTQEFKQRMASNFEESMRSAGVDAGVISARLAELEEAFDLHDGPLPYWDSFHIDRQGNTWLRHFSLPGQPSTQWRVLRRDGVLVGSIDLPEVASILDIADDLILAVRLDELDVPAVVMLQYVR